MSNRPPAGALQGRRAVSVRLGCLVSLAVAAAMATNGCSRPTDLAYVSRPEAIQLPQSHQQQIRQVLEDRFGTAVAPVVRRATGEDEGGESPAPRASAEQRQQLQRLKLGQQVYQRRCAGCHGVTGDGNGPAAAYLNPRPRDYRLGVFKFTSTPYGLKPRRQDLIRIIRTGAKGTSMPAFPWVSNDELQAVVDYVILLSQRGELERFLVVEAEEYPADEPLEDELVEELEQQVVQSWSPEETPRVIPRTAMPLMTDETIELGRQAFLSRGCAKCHGEDGRGHTQENVGKDAWGNTVKAADLTSGMLRGGRRPLDVYLRIQTGINGTPMPDFATALAEEPETTWHLAHYILHLANRRGTTSQPGNTQGDGAAGAGAPGDGTQGATQSDGTAQQ